MRGKGFLEKIFFVVTALEKNLSQTYILVAVLVQNCAASRSSVRLKQVIASKTVR
jgi:hypothetical protein